MKLPSLRDLAVKNQRVLLRTNYDVPLTADGQVADGTRIYESFETIKFLVGQKAKIIIISHLDRPGGKSVPGLSLKPVVERMTTKLGKIKIGFSRKVLGEGVRQAIAKLGHSEVLVLENLRFDIGETTNNKDFARNLAKLGDLFINDAFAVSHRSHASIVGLPKLLPTGFGLDFLQEVKLLSQVKSQPARPVVLILGGRKKSKLEVIDKILNWVDYVLVGGELVEYPGFKKFMALNKVVASLTKRGEDITMETAGRFEEVIAKAKTLIWSGPMGAFEDEKFRTGTQRIAQAVSQAQAFKVVGGGDTEAALTKLNLKDKLDYISSGGSAMLAYLANGTLPGIEAVKK